MTPKQKKWAIIGGIVIVLAIIGSLTKGDDKETDDTAATTTTEQSTTSSAAEEPASTPTSTASDEEAEAAAEPDESTLDITTSELKRTFSSMGISLSKGEDVRGYENWYGSSSLNVGQILCHGEDVYEASVVLGVDLAEPSDASARQSRKFLDAIHPKAGKNIAREIGQEDLLEPWTENESVGKVKFEMRYVIDGTVGLLSITAKPRW